TWVVKANNRAYHAQIQKRHLWCLKKRKYADNAIKTAKYNFFTFLPLNLYEQFHRMANVYFLLMILLQTFPQISTLPWFALLFPLCILLSIRGIRDLIDDVVSICFQHLQRHPSNWMTVCNLLEEDSRIILFSSPLSNCPGEVVCEEPNSRLHNFIGTLEWHGEKYPLDYEKILLRGCRVRNTEVCYGLVIYAGKGARSVLLFMESRLEGTSEVIYYLFAFYRHTSAVSYAFFAFWGFLILLSLVIPMSMLITFEFIYLVNSCFINWDTEMYYAEKDTPANARSTSLNDQLGQIEYIFSDKTGTLTQNIMTFKKCCINGNIYGNEGIQNAGKCIDLSWNKYIDKKLEFHDQLLLDTIRRDQDPVVREYMRLLALCHTVMVEEKESELVYQAASPDEEALVTAARNLGYVFLSRTQDTITISELGIQRTYKVLALLDFNSVRKRMSVLVQDPEGCIKLYTKGADSVILERLHGDRTNESCTIKALDSFAAETLRTLCLAMKEMDKKEYALWSKKHHAASILLQGRAQELDKVYEEIEQNLKLLGATAIEDKLQDGVPETIHLLKRGDIKVWVLTGDKQETAVNIGFACQLLSEDMIILEESKIRYGAMKNVFGSLVGFKFFNYWFCGCGLVGVAGEGLFLLDLWTPARNLIEKAFVELATTCQAVICCRVTPKQKALIVQMVKRHKNSISLAIGDGANDVNMIKTADIGVGISGQEGMQAVQCSDYALAQFRYLQRLLFVHGKWSYLRICKFLRYFFFKTFAGMMVQIWFAFYTGFTAQPLLEGWFLALYNVIYTSFPVLCLGLFEQDVNAKKSLQFPELYKAGQKDLFFNFGIFFVSFIHGSFVSLVNFYVTMWAMGDRSGVRVTGDYQSFGMIVATSAILTVMAEVSNFVCANCPTQSIFLSPPEATRNALTDPTAVLVMLLCVVVNIIPSLAVRFVYNTISPPTMSEIQKKQSTVELISHNSRNSLLRRSSYAFSHKEGYAHLIAKGASLRSKRIPVLSATGTGPCHPKKTVFAPVPNLEGFADLSLEFLSLGKLKSL
uniref:Phospholipid-transporting ATPase n=1 Tax=Naja naja TaxID=35670 RepID=A0A8C6VCD9_NAJNA